MLQKDAHSKSSRMANLETFKPDLIILDVMLGKDDGRLICRELKNSEYNHIPILMYSASRLMLEHWEEYNADNRIEKPFHITQLQNRVEPMLTAHF